MKLCQIFDKDLPFAQYYCAKTLSNLCQIFNKNLIQQLTQYNSGRMIYFRENLIPLIYICKVFIITWKILLCDELDFQSLGKYVR